jgi:hypothetical protein
VKHALRHALASALLGALMALDFDMHGPLPPVKRNQVAPEPNSEPRHERVESEGMVYVSGKKTYQGRGILNFQTKGGLVARS